MAHEEWRDVVGYEGSYQVSSIGRVRSVDRRMYRKNDPVSRMISGKILKPKQRVGGADVVNLNKDFSRTAYRIDRLVAEAFIGIAPNNDMVVVHTNGDVHDCSAANLEWSAVREDTLDGEEWRDVVNYEGIYQVSSFGRVRSIDRIDTRSDGSKYPLQGCMIKRRTSKCGYETVLLHRDANVSPMRVDVLVANAFIREGTNDQFVHHVNGDVGDSYVSNLRWVNKDDYGEVVLGNHVDEKAPEEWRDISGYEGRYQVSSLGRVKRLARTIALPNGSTRNVSELVMRQQVNGMGRLMVILTSSDGKSKSHQVHRLVACAFIENERGLEQVDHINSIATDNRVTNLRWCDRTENIRHCVEFGNVKRPSSDAPGESTPSDEIEGEEWRDVPWAVGIYQVSNIGRVRSKDRFVDAARGSKRMVRGRILKTHKMKSGYIELKLSGKIAYVHRLVAQAFIPNPDNLTEVDHIDCDKSNNHVENLRWCTHKENVGYAIESGILNPSATSKAFHATKEGKQLEERQRRARSRPVIRDDGVTYPSARAAADAIGYSYSAVKDVLMGRAKRCNGHSYRYADGSKARSWDHRRREVLQIDPTTNEVITTYPSRAEAVMATDNTGIGNCLRGAAKTSAGYIWRYADEVA